MFNLFNLLYITPFYFPNGKSSPKNKYYIPIYIEDDEIVFAFLPTRNIRIEESSINHGCTNVSDKQYSCYIFKENTPITNCGFSFEFNTCVYSFQLNEFSKKLMSEIYKIEDVEFEIIGELTLDEKTELLKCFIQSKYIKRKVKRALQVYLTNIT